MGPAIYSWQIPGEILANVDAKKAGSHPTTASRPNESNA